MIVAMSLSVIQMGKSHFSKCKDTDKEKVEGNVFNIEKSRYI